MSSDGWWCNCQACGYGRASKMKDNRMYYYHCPICGWHENDTEELYDYCIEDFRENALDEVDPEDDDAVQEKMDELFNEYVKEEFGRDNWPNPIALSELKKIASTLNVCISEMMTLDKAFLDYLDIDEYNTELNSAQSNKLTCNQFFASIRKQDITNLLSGVFNV